jgi:hypothetical protein
MQVIGYAYVTHAAVQPVTVLDVGVVLKDTAGVAVPHTDATVASPVGNKYNT